MITRLSVLLALLMLSIAAVGCTPPAPQPDGPLPPAEQPADPAAGGGATRPAPGLYDLSDGTVQAVGTVEYSDIEGGFWFISGGTEAEGNLGETVAVIANGDAFTSQLEDLKGSSAIVTGKRLDGASIRMAGPEIEATSIEPIDDTPGPAE